MEVQSNILDPIHDSLPESVWDNPADPRPSLKAQHRKWITATVTRVLKDAGYTHVEGWLDLVLTGSLTTYQYSAESDCDVSLFVNAEVFPEWSRAELIGLMVSHVDGTKLPGTGYLMQCFVVPPDIKQEDLFKPGLRSGYDLEKDEWVEPPDRYRAHDVQREQNNFYVYALEQADKMERLLRYEPDKAILLWHQIHKRRQRDQRAGKGDYSESNIIYKFLANRGLFPAISEASGEYIAKQAWFGQDKEPKQYNQFDFLKYRYKDKYDDEYKESVRQHYENERANSWDQAFKQGISPHERNRIPGVPPGGNLPPLVRSDDEWRETLGRVLWRHGGYTPEQDAAWHQNYQQAKQQEYLNSPTARPEDWENWTNWYAQHAPQHFDPQGSAAQDESHLQAQPPAPKGVFGAEVTDRDLQKWPDYPPVPQSQELENHDRDQLNIYSCPRCGQEVNWHQRFEMDTMERKCPTCGYTDVISMPGGKADPLEQAYKHSKKEFTKFIYDPTTNHLVLGNPGAEEGENESHNQLLHKSGINPENAVFGQFDSSGHVETFGRPLIRGFSQPSVNQYEADYKLKQALDQAVPGLSYSVFEPPHDAWDSAGPPQISYIGQKPTVNPDEQIESPTEEGQWKF